MKRKVVLFLVLFVPGLLLAYNNCVGNGASVGGLFASMGTEIGNPGGGQLRDVQTSQIIVAACIALGKCNASLDMNSCIAGALQAPNTDSALGLSAGSYANLSAIQNAEAQGTINANPSFISACASDLSALVCSTPQVAQAYDPTNAASPFANFSQIFNVPSLSCSQVF